MKLVKMIFVAMTLFAQTSFASNNAFDFEIVFDGMNLAQERFESGQWSLRRAEKHVDVLVLGTISMVKSCKELKSRQAFKSPKSCEQGFAEVRRQFLQERQFVLPKYMADRLAILSSRIAQ